MAPDDELEPIADQEEAKARTLGPELTDEAEDYLAWLGELRQDDPKQDDPKQDDPKQE